MTPFWIIIFLEKDSCESFFNAYWNAYIQNSQGEDIPLKHFYITDGNSDNLTREELNEIAFKKLTISTDNAEKLIPAFTSNKGNRINVIFIGDITQEKTIERFHTWAAYLQQQRMLDVNRPWFSISSVSMYGILLRPDTIAVDDDLLTGRVKGFLNELNTLEKMDENYRPFKKIFFIQSHVKKEERVIAEFSANLAAYHIARTDGQFLKDYDKQYYDTGATAVFFESAVQREVDAFNLSAIMLHDMALSEDSAFVDIDEAKKFVEDNQSYVETLRPSDMMSFFVAGSPDFPVINAPKLPGGFFSVMKGEIWKNYFNEMKSNLVNNVSQVLSNYDKVFCERLYDRQKEFITERSDALQDLVFQMFCDTVSQNRFKHIGLTQCLKVLEMFKSKIVETFKSKGESIQAFVMPGFPLGLIKDANAKGLTSEKVLNTLNVQLQHQFVYSKSRLLLLALAGTIVGGLLAFLSPIALLTIPLPLLIDLMIYNTRVKRIESLKNQYIGLRLQKLLEHLNDQILRCVDKTQQEMRQYLKWLRDNKIVWLQNNLSVMAVPDPHFKSNKVFQPLLTNPTVLTTSLIASKQLILSKETLLFESGSFGNRPITKNVPTAQVMSVENGAFISLVDLIEKNKRTVQSLIQKLMRRDEDVIGGKEQAIGFQKHEGSITNRRLLLLLDVSGSMFGEMNSLKEYVKNLEEIGEIDWIAFDDKVVTTSYDTEVEELSSGGGTCYIPAIDKAVEWVKSDDYDDVVLLSDGMPFETVEKIVSAANKLNQPLNTIAIGGNAAENVLVEIALNTGGEEVSVDSYDDLKSKEVWNNEILPRLAILNDGNYTFGELLKHTQIAACARALRKYALKCLETSSVTTPELFIKYLNESGFEEWLSVASQCNTLAPSIEPVPERYCFATSKKPKVEEMEKALRERCKAVAMDFDSSKDEPEMIVSLLSVRPLVHIGDLQWAASMKHGDKSINDIDLIKGFMREGDACYNVYDEEI